MSAGGADSTGLFAPMTSPPFWWLFLLISRVFSDLLAFGLFLGWGFLFGVFFLGGGGVGRQCLGWMVLFVGLGLVLFVGFSGGGLGFWGFFCCNYFEPTSAPDIFKGHVGVPVL